MGPRRAGAPPLVSFATTAYRTEHYVGTTIATVLAQTDPDWELVVVDNGRVDAMATVVEPFTADPRVRLVRQDNRGYIGGLESAVAAATGAWVVPLDSDDQVVPHLVARLRRLREELPEAVGICWDAHLFSDEHDEPTGRGYDHSIGVDPTPAGGDTLTRRHLLSGRTPYYGGAVRREVWHEVGGYVTSADDVDEVIDFWWRLVGRGQVALVPDRLGRYRVRDDSLSRDSESVEAFERTLLNTYLVHGRDAEPADREAAESTRTTLLYFQALRRARAALMAGEVATARREARAALRHRRTPRALAVLAAVTLAPRLLVRVHPAKRRVSTWLQRRLTVRAPAEPTGALIPAVSPERSAPVPPGTPTSGGPSSPPATSS